MDALQAKVGQMVEVYSLWNGHPCVERGILNSVKPYMRIELGDESTGRTYKSKPFVGSDVIRLIFDEDGQYVYAAEIPNDWFPASDEKIQQLREYMFGPDVAE